jgi:hypothetical protein
MCLAGRSDTNRPLLRLNGIVCSPGYESDKGIIESKRDIYRAHPSCTCILLVRQDRSEIIVDRRTADGWRSQVLHAADEPTVPELGLTCRVRDRYRDTPLG